MTSTDRKAQGTALVVIQVLSRQVEMELLLRLRSLCLHLQGDALPCGNLEARVTSMALNGGLSRPA